MVKLPTATQLRRQCHIIKYSCIFLLVFFSVLACGYKPEFEHSTICSPYIFLLLPLIEAIILIPLGLLYAKKMLPRLSPLPPQLHVFLKEVLLSALVAGCGMVGLGMIYFMQKIYLPAELPLHVLYLNLIYPASAVVFLLLRTVPPVPADENNVVNLERSRAVQNGVSAKNPQLVLTFMKWAMIVAMVAFTVAILTLGSKGEQSPDMFVWIGLFLPFGMEAFAMIVYPIFKKLIASTPDVTPAEKMFAGEILAYALIESCGLTALVFAFVILHSYNPSSLAWYVRYINLIHPVIAIIALSIRPVPTIPADTQQ